IPRRGVPGRHRQGRHPTGDLARDRADLDADPGGCGRDRRPRAGAQGLAPRSCRRAALRVSGPRPQRGVSVTLWSAAVQLPAPEGLGSPGLARAIVPLKAPSRMSPRAPAPTVAVPRTPPLEETL